MVLGFDFGMKYIGVATGQEITKTASPLKSLQAKDGIPDWDEVANLIKEWAPQALIVGNPINMDGTTQEITNCANKFAGRLKHKFKLPVHMVDERLTTWEAKQRLTDANIAKCNAEAAAIITEQWLNL